MTSRQPRRYQSKTSRRTKNTRRQSTRQGLKHDRGSVQGIKIALMAAPVPVILVIVLLFGMTFPSSISPDPVDDGGTTPPTQPPTQPPPTPPPVVDPDQEFPSWSGMEEDFEWHYGILNIYDGNTTNSESNGTWYDPTGLNDQNSTSINVTDGYAEINNYNMTINFGYNFSSELKMSGSRVSFMIDPLIMNMTTWRIVMHGDERVYYGGVAFGNYESDVHNGTLYTTNNTGWINYLDSYESGNWMNFTFDLLNSSFFEFRIDGVLKDTIETFYLQDSIVGLMFVSSSAMPPARGHSRILLDNITIVVGNDEVFDYEEDFEIYSNGLMNLYGVNTTESEKGGFWYNLNSTLTTETLNYTINDGVSNIHVNTTSIGLQDPLFAYNFSREISVNNSLISFDLMIEGNNGSTITILMHGNDSEYIGGIGLITSDLNTNMTSLHNNSGVHEIFGMTYERYTWFKVSFRIINSSSFDYYLDGIYINTVTTEYNQSTIRGISFFGSYSSPSLDPLVYFSMDNIYIKD